MRKIQIGLILLLGCSYFLTPCIGQSISAAEVAIYNSQNIVNDESSYIFKVLANPAILPAGTIVKTYFPSTVTLDPEADLSLSECFWSDTQNGEFDLSCSYDLSSRSFQFQVSSEISFNTMFKYQIGTFINPSSAISLTGFAVELLNSNGVVISSKSITSSAQIQPNTFASYSVTSSSSQTSATSSYQLDVTTSDKIPASGYLKIVIPSDITVPSLSTSNLAIKIGGSTKSGFSLSQSSRTLTITNLISSDIAAGTVIQVTISNLENPQSFKPTGSFVVTLYTSAGYKVNEQSTGLTVTMTTEAAIQVVDIGPYTFKTVGETTEINFHITLPSYSEGGYLVVKFPPEISVANLECDILFGFEAGSYDCILDGSDNSVFLNAQVSAETVFFLIGDVTNPANTEPSSSFEIYYYDSSDYKMSSVTQDTFYTVNPGTLTLSTYTRSTTSVGDSSSLTVSFTLQNDVLSSEYINIQIPKDDVDLTSSSLTVTYSSNSKSFTFDSSSANYYSIYISAPCSPCGSGTELTFVLSGGTNKAYVKEDLSYSLFVQTVTSDKQYQIDESESELFISPDLEPGTLSSVTLKKQLQFVGGSTQFDLKFTTQNEVPNDGLIRIYFPQSATYYPDSGQPYSLDIGNGAISRVCNIISYDDTSYGIYYIEIVNQCKTSCNANTMINIKFTNLKNPGSEKPITNSFKVETLTKEGYAIDRATITSATGLSLIASSFTSISLEEPTSPIVTGNSDDYEFKLNSLNGIVYQSGILVINFPSACEIQSGASCSAQANSKSLDCAIDVTAQTASVSNPHSDETFRNTDITIEVSKVKNPLSIETSSAFVFDNQLYDDDTSQYYNVDEDDGSIKVTPDTPKKLTGVSVTRSATLINEATTLAIVFTAPNKVKSSSIITISFPKDQVLVSSVSDFSIKNTNNNQAITKLSSTEETDYYVIELREWCSLGESYCAAGTQFKLTVTGTYNLGTTAEPDDSFIIEIEQANGADTHYIDSGVLALPYLSVGPFKSVTFSQSSNTVGDHDGATFTITSVIKDFISSTTATFSYTFPDEFLYVGIEGLSTTCKVNSVSETCSVTSSSSTLGDYLTDLEVSVDCTQIGGCAVDDSISLTIAGISNRFSSASYSSTDDGSGLLFLINSQDANGDSINFSSVEFEDTGLQDELDPSTKAEFTSITGSSSVTGAESDLSIKYTLNTRFKKESTVQIWLPQDAVEYLSGHVLSCYFEGQTVNEFDCEATEEENHVVIEFEEYCSESDYCPEGTQLGMVLRGFRNNYHVGDPDYGFFVEVIDPDGNLVETNDPAYYVTLADTAATPTNFQLTPGDYEYVGDFSSFSLSFTQPTLLKEGNLISVSFSSAFLLASSSESCTFQGGNFSPEQVSCNWAYSSVGDELTSLEIEVPYDMDSDLEVVIRLLDAYNLLEAKSVKVNQIQIEVYTEEDEQIAELTSSFGPKKYLLPQNFTSVSATRKNGVIDYGQPLDVEITLRSPITLLEDSVIHLSVPLTQFLLEEDASDVACFKSGVELDCEVDSQDSDYYYLQINTADQFCTDMPNCLDQSARVATLSLEGFRNPYQAYSNTLSFDIEITHSGNECVINHEDRFVYVYAKPALLVQYFDDLVVFQNGSFDTGGETEFLFYFTLPSIMESSSKAVVEFPNETASLLYGSSSLFCTDDSEDIEFSCSYSNYSSFPFIYQVEVEDLCEKIDCEDEEYNVTIKISNVQNTHYYRDRDSDRYFNVYTVTGSDFIVEQGNFSDDGLASLQVRALSAPTATRSSPDVGTENVVVEFRFSSPNLIPESAYVDLWLRFEQMDVEDRRHVRCGKEEYAYTLKCEAENETDGGMVIRMQEWCQGDCVPGYEIIFQIKDVINPFSLFANFPVEEMAINVTTVEGYPIEQYSGLIKIEPDLDGIQISDVLVSRTENYIGDEDYLQIQIPISQQLDTSTQLVITLPKQVAFQTDAFSQTCEQFSYKEWQSRSCSFDYYTSADTQYDRYSISNITISGVCPTMSLCTEGRYILLRLRVRNPFFQQQQRRQRFTYYLLVDSLLAGYSEIPTKLDALSPNLIQSSLQYGSADSCTFTGKECSATINIQTTNPVPNKLNEGWLVINVPTQMQVNTQKCKAYLFDSMEMDCNISSGFQIQVRHDQEISNQTLSYQVRVELSKVQNPFSTQPSDSFEIISYQLIENITYLVDRSLDDLHVTVKNPSTFKSVSVERSVTGISENTALSFSIRLRNRMPDNSTLRINIPTTQAVMAANAQVGCWMNSGLSVQFLECQLFNETAFEVGKICEYQECEEGSLLTFQIGCSYYVNTGYLKDPLTDEDSVSITGYYKYNKTEYYTDQTLNQVFIKPDVAPLNDFNVKNLELASYMTSDIVDLTFKMEKKSSKDKFTQDYLVFKFEGAKFSAHPNYDISVTVGGYAVEGLEIQTNSDRSISQLWFKCLQKYCKSENSLSIKLANVQNPPYIQDSYSSDQFLLYAREASTAPSIIISQDIFDFSSSILPSLTLQPLQNAYFYTSPGLDGEKQGFELQFSLANNPYIESTAQLMFKLPDDFSMDQSDLSCGQLVEDMGSFGSCKFYSSNNTLVLDGYFADPELFMGMPISTVGIEIDGIIPPLTRLLIAASSTGNQGAIEFSINSGTKIYASNDEDFILKQQDVSIDCKDTSCGLCGADGTCYECKWPSSTPFLYNNTCVDKCPSDTYKQAKVCYPCGEGCSSCTKAGHCTECEDPYLFIDGACVEGECPDGTTEENNQCVRTDGCSDECQKCGVDPNYCYECYAPKVSTAGECSEQCESGYFLLEGKACEQCSPECKECEGTATTCTTCYSEGVTMAFKYDMSIQSCVSECSPYSFQSPTNSSLCQSCNPECETCYGTGDNCTSCTYLESTYTDLFYFEGECLESCPSSTYQNYDTHECEDSSFSLSSLPPLFLISTVGLTALVAAASKGVAYKAGMASSTSDIFIFGLTQAEFLNRLMNLGNLWFSTKTFTFCVTGMTMTGNALLGVYFTAMIINPISTQMAGASTGPLFTLATGLTQISGLNSIRIVTSNFLGIKAFSNSFGKMPYYSSQLEFLSLLSSGLCLFQMGAGASEISDFASSQDAFGFGINSMLLNSGLIGLQGFKYWQAKKLMKGYSVVG